VTIMGTAWEPGVARLVHEPPDAWLLQLPFETPLSLNDRQGYWATAKGRRAWLEASVAVLEAAGVPHCHRVRATLFYTPKQDRRRDPDNLVASYKPVVDALVVAGVLDDDTQEYVDRVWPVIRPKDKALVGGRFHLRVERLA